jgi:hypothetical protein
MSQRTGTLVPTVLISQTITRPDNTTAYASGDLVANSATAASVTPFAFDVTEGGNPQISVRVDRVRLRKSTTSTTNAAFRVHFYDQAPGAPTNGDNGAIVAATIGHRGYVDVTVDIAGTTGSVGHGVPSSAPILIETKAGVIYALLEARGAYTPGAQEGFTLQCDAYKF